MILPAALLALGLLGGAPTWAQPSRQPEPVSGLPGDAVAAQVDAAREAEERGDLRRAAAGYSLALRRDPTFLPAVLGLGRVREAQGDVPGAIAAYRLMPNEPAAVESLAGLLEERDPAAAVRAYRRLTTLMLGDPEPHRALARVLAGQDPVAAADELETYLQLMALEGEEPDGEVMIRVAVGLREAGRIEQAEALLRRCVALLPEGPYVEEARGRIDRIAVEQAARTLAVGGAEALSPQLTRRVEAGRRAAARGDLDGALATLRDVVQRAPRSAEARAALGDVQALRGEVAAAERAYDWAVALEPDQSAWHARLGLLLAQRYGGRRHTEAAEELQRALALRPSWSEILVHLAQVQQGLGDWDAALQSYRAYLDAEPDGPEAEQARQQVEDLLRVAPDPPQVQVEREAPDGVSGVAVEHYRVARIYMDRGQLDQARAELQLAFDADPAWPAAVNLQAALDLREGDVAAALDAWARSLQLQPDQPRVRLALGELRWRQGRREEAVALLTRAAQGGAADAWYKLAEIAAAEGRLFAADRLLQRYFRASTGGLSHEPARQLLERVRRRIHILQGGAAAALAVVLMLVGGWWWRRRTGATLADLVARAPESAQELTRLLSAIRHEVLKHNTTLLDDVAHALSHGDHHAVAFAADRLFGEGDDDGVFDRMDAYLGAISRLGRRHGLRMDLKHRDPVLSPMWRAMRRLRRLEPVLRRPWRTRASVAQELHALSRVLNDEGYRALGELVRTMGVVPIQAELLAEIDRRVRAEPGVAELSPAPLDLMVPAQPVAARVLAGELADIVANLLRNAYIATRGDRSGRVGLAVGEGDDPITGLEYVVLRFLDNAPGELTDAMIHGRDIGRGLGLVVDLIARHDGSVSVEHRRAELAAGWTKAVVVRLPLADTDENPSTVEVEEV